ncbi:hypothetical protein PVN37_22455 [Bacillus licheniformis]|uniref:hypothetical protein n=1 Tax=Bacillus TaxID=1386 RepID=UPI00237CD34D|nr:hypothetical protein [Bacillus licheniformis]MDE1429431.1 hypothetical protein [Bacillus licheniformis]
MQFYSVKEVAIKLGLSIKIIENMCEKGRFKDAYQTDNGWLIPVGNFITSREQDHRAEAVLKQIDAKNRKADKDIVFIDAQIVADYYGVTLKEVNCWIKQRKISGKKDKEDPKRYLVPKEEFEYLKEKRETDDINETIKELLGNDFTEWDLDIDD